MQLTSRERLLRLFHGGDIDRIPIWLLSPYHDIEYYAPIYRLPCYAPVVKAMENTCDIFDRRRPYMGFTYNTHPSIQMGCINDSQCEGTFVTCGKDRFESYISRKNGRTSRHYYINEPEELKSLLAWPYSPPRPNLEIFRQEKKELGERGLFMMDLGDPLEPLYHLCDAADFAIWTLTDLDALLEFTDVMYERTIDLYRYFLEADIADAYFIVGSEFAGPPLVSPALFTKLCKRYVKGIVDLIRNYNKISIIHFHGNIHNLLHGFSDIGPDGLHTIEAPPMGDCTISQAREVLGDNTVLIGNIQYDDLAHKEPDEIRNMVREVIREGKSGRFILSPSAGPYEWQPSDTTIRNYVAMIEAGIEYGRLT